MFYIAVCDDEKKWLDEIEVSLQNYAAAQQNVQIEIDCFLHPDELLKQVTNEPAYDAYFLDIYLSGTNGIELAQKLRSEKIEKPIVFLTVSRQHALEAFGVSAAGYILKPFLQEVVFETMDRQILKFKEDRRSYITFKMQAGFRKVSMRDIVFSEAKNNYQEIVLCNKEVIRVRMTASKLYEELSANFSFVRCGAAYIINLAYVQQMNSKKITLEDGTIIHIPRGWYSSIKEQYFNYYCEK